LCKICQVRNDCDFYRTGVLTRPINRKVAAEAIAGKATRQKAAARAAKAAVRRAKAKP
jgi:hypothetical protein